MRVEWAPMQQVVPAGQHGDVRVDHVAVSEDDARWASVRGEVLSAGPLARLFVNRQLMMSDGDMEHRTNWRAVREAHGDVLVAGLGLGMILVPMLQNPAVKAVVVLEQSYAVMRLVEGPVRQYVGYEASAKLRVIEADVFKWRPDKGQTFDCIYFDIWPTICTDNLKGVTQLKRRYARRLRRDNPRAWMRAWMEEILRNQRRRDRKRGEYEPNFRCGFGR